MTRIALFALVVLAGCSSGEQPVSLSIESPRAIPFERQHNLVFVPVRLDDSPESLWFILDSGSSRMLVDQRVANNLDLPMGEFSTVQGAGLGRVAVQRIESPLDMTVGETRSAAHQFDSIDLGGVSRAIGRRIDGILGYEFFARYVVTVDYASRMVTLDDPAEWRGLEGASELELTIRDRWPLVRGTLHIPGVGAVTDEFLVDLGSGDAVNHPAIKQSTGYLRQTVTGVGIGFPTTGHVGTATRFELGPFSMRNISVACCGATQATSRIIGAAVLSRFTCAFDYSRQRLYLKPARAM